MLWNVRFGLRFIFLNLTLLCSCREIVPRMVALLFLLFVHWKMVPKGLKDDCCRVTGTEWTNTILLTMKLLRIIIYVLDCGLCPVPVLCHQVNIHQDLEPQSRFCDGMHWLTVRFKRFVMQTDTITRRSACISTPLSCITWQCDCSNWAKPGYGGIIRQSWLNVSILEFSVRKERYPADPIRKYIEIDHT